MALDQRLQSRFAGIQRRHLQKMPQFVNQHPFVHRIQPRLHLAEQLQVRGFRQVAFGRRNRNIDSQLLRQRHVNRENGTRFLPLRLARSFGPRRR